MNDNKDNTHGRMVLPLWTSKVGCYKPFIKSAMVEAYPDDDDTGDDTDDANDDDTDDNDDEAIWLCWWYWWR